MPKTSQSLKPTYTQNRELSWLRFNQRVLEEANDHTNPPMERLKFVSIFASNLDEFFMVRAGSLFDIAAAGSKAVDSKSGLTPSEQLDRIYSTVPGLIKLKKQIYASVMADLAEHGIVDLSNSALEPKETEYLDRYYKANIRPLLSPIIIGPHHPVPHLVNKRLYVAASLKDKKGKPSVGLLPIPTALPSYLVFPNTDTRFIRMEHVILPRIAELFGTYRVEETCLLTATRNADLSFDDEKFEDIDGDIRSHMTKLLKKRDHLAVIRLELNKKVSDTFLAQLLALVKIAKHQVTVDSCPLNMKYVFQLAGELTNERAAQLLYPPYTPRQPEDISRGHSILEQVEKQDKLLFYPFDTIDPFLRLLTEAAEQEDTIAIKITIYRLASLSKIARALCRAAENGKEVTVLMELRARFDEANNVAWSKLLEESGCHVIYGIEDFKCHSKICHITMRTNGKLRYITQVGTGNYNEKTTTIYTDLSIITADERIGEDGAAFFQNMLVNNLEGHYRALCVSPHGIKHMLLTNIDEQIALGTDGYICIKVNAVTEREVIDKLAEASRAGVEVQLIVRGICCILPGVPSHTENVHVTSIVGRYLEHARIYVFGRGDDAKFYIASADLMTRNLNHRVEIACPIYDPELKQQLRYILTTQLADTVKASFMMSDGSYCRKQGRIGTTSSSQQVFMDTSIHKETSFEPPKPTFTAQFTSLWDRLKQVFKG